MTADGSRLDDATFGYNPGARVWALLPATVDRPHAQDCRPGAHVTLDDPAPLFVPLNRLAPRDAHLLEAQRAELHLELFDDALQALAFRCQKPKEEP